MIGNIHSTTSISFKCTTNGQSDRKHSTVMTIFALKRKNKTDLHENIYCFKFEFQNYHGETYKRDNIYIRYRDIRDIIYNPSPV